MLAAVSREDSIFDGGISGSGRTKAGTVVVVPLARLSLRGDWEGLRCDADHVEACIKFEREYLKYPHTYSVISADGHDAIVYSAPTGLTGCYGFNGLGHYTGTEIKSSAIAASSASIFAEGLGPQRLYDEKAGAIRRALAALIPGKLDSVEHLRLFSLKLERQDIVVVQRSMADLAGTKRLQPSKFVFYDRDNGRRGVPCVPLE